MLSELMDLKVQTAC